MKEHLIPADFLVSKKVTTPLNEFLNQQFGVENLAPSFSNYHFSFDVKKINEQKLNYDAVKKAAVSFLQKQPGIQFAVDIDNIGSAPIPEPIKTKIINGYNTKRSGPVMIIPDAGWFSGSEGGTGTTHGSWNPYDTHIPLVFMGWGIKPGATNRYVRMSDISPTLAALLHIQMPNGNVGEVIGEVVR